MKLLLLAPLIALTSCKGPPKEPAPQPEGNSHQKMITLLESLKQSTMRNHPYFSQKNLISIRDMHAQLPDDAPVLQRWKISYNLGLQEQAHGTDDAAVKYMEEAYRLLKAHPESFQPQHRDITLFQTGMAWLRLGESQNCCALNTPEACIIPLAPSALHTKPEGSTKAMIYFIELARTSAVGSAIHLRALWLLNLAAHTLGKHPDSIPENLRLPASTYHHGAEFPHFMNRSKALGLDTYSLSGGAIAEDFDNDGDLDLLVSAYSPDEQLQLHQNQGNGSFKNITEQANLLGLYGGLNMVQADYDNDGHVDILILRGAWFRQEGLKHPNSLLRNLGDGTFQDVTFDVGLGDKHYPTQSGAWSDYDLDGDLDLYIANETVDGVSAPCQLFRNDGEEGFSEVGVTAGVTNDGFSKAAVWGDINSDRYPDLFVSNYSGPNRLYLNNCDGTFTDIAEQADVQRPHCSFPAWFWDFDNDGNLDLFVSSYVEPVIEHLTSQALGKTITADTQKLYQGDGQGNFIEVSLSSRLRHPHNPMGANFGDLNADGFLDFYLGTGNPNFWELAPNAMYLNQHGRRFQNVSASGGFGHLQKGHAVVFADFDEDGDQDIFEQLGGAITNDKFHDAYFENPGFGNQWIKVKAIGTRSNKSAIGARITVYLDNGKKIVRFVSSGGSFGANPLRQYFGLGKGNSVTKVEIYWPTSDQTQVVKKPSPGKTLVVTEN